MTRETFEKAEKLQRQLKYVEEALSFFVYFNKKYDVVISSASRDGQSIRINWIDDTGYIANTIRELLENRGKEIKLEIEKL